MVGGVGWWVSGLVGGMGSWGVGGKECVGIVFTSLDFRTKCARKLQVSLVIIKNVNSTNVHITVQRRLFILSKPSNSDRFEV